MIVRRLALVSAAAALAPAASAPAFAAGPVTVAPDPVVEAPLVMPAPTYDWSGPYVGGQLGWAWARGEGANTFDGIDLDADGVIGGVTGGYRRDFGNWVLGGELQYDWADTEFNEIDVGGTSLDVDDEGRLNDIWRVKGTAGYDLGRTLIYGSVGWAGASAEIGDEDYDSTGWLVGAGVDYMVNDRFSIGGELMYHDFDEFGGDGENFDVDATTLQAKTTFRF